MNKKLTSEAPRRYPYEFTLTDGTTITAKFTNEEFNNLKRYIPRLEGKDNPEYIPMAPNEESYGISQSSIK